MTTQAEKTELQGRIDALYRLIYDLNKEVADIEVKEPVKKGPWIPESDERYEYIGDAGNIVKTYWANDERDNSRLRVANVFPVGKAKAVADQRLAEVRVINRLREVEKGEAVDWGDSHQRKYHPTYRYDEMCLSFAVRDIVRASNNSWYTTDPEAWTKVIKEMEEDVRAMLWI